MSMILTVKCVFWFCTALVATAYIGYPASLVVLRSFRRRRPVGKVTPSVTLLISAYNEAAIIREKIDNSLELDYPSQRLEIVVVSDASDDGTDEIVAEYADRGVVLFRQQQRRGKSAGLTESLPLANGEIIVFSDANSMYAKDAIRKLVRHFDDERVGYVVGHQGYFDGDGAAAVSESLYWRYETWIKELESRVGSVVGGDGAIFAIRSELFEPLRDDDINDFIIPLRIVVRGFRGVFDREAVCYEHTADDFRGEFRRKTRIVSRSFRAVLRVPQALNPLRVGLFAYQLAAHKVLRWLVPWFLLALLATNIVLARPGQTVYQVTLGLQSAFYGLATLRLVPGIKHWKPVYIAYYFCLVNAASALGTLSFALGRRFVTWTPQRTPQNRLYPTHSRHEAIGSRDVEG